MLESMLTPKDSGRPTCILMLPALSSPDLDTRLVPMTLSPPSEATGIPLICARRFDAFGLAASREGDRGFDKAALAVTRPAETRTLELSEVVEVFLFAAPTGKEPGRLKVLSRDGEVAVDDGCTSPSPAGSVRALLLRGRMGGRSITVIERVQVERRDDGIPQALFRAPRGLESVALSSGKRYATGSRLQVQSPYLLKVTVDVLPIPASELGL